MSQSRTHTKRPARGFRRGLYAAAALAGLCAFLTLAGAAGAQHRTTAAHTPRTLAALPQTVVSLTFDDGDATQYQTRTMLSSRGFHATYFLNSGNIGTDSSYMTWAQVQNLYSDGNEIGGHTITHPDLTTLSATEAAREVCYDRNIILSHGYPVTDFAYPFGTSTPAIESMVHNCGYNSARATDEFGQGCAPGPCSETIPPRDAYRTFVVGDGDDGLANIEKQITLAENNGGGWAQLLFHDICSGCSGHSFSVANLTTLLNWLQGQVQTNNVVIKTVNQVIGGPVQPSVPGPPLPPPPNGTNAMPNPSLETDADGDGVPDCYFTNTWGNETAAWARTNDAHTGGWAEKVTVSTYSSGSSSLLANLDLGDCAPTVTAGHQYRVTEWYKSTAPVSFDLYYRSTSWFWSYATSSGNFPASSTWAQATWVTPVIPAGTNGAIAGLEIAANGTLTVDDLALDDANPSTDSTPPSTTVSCNAAACSSGWYAAPVTVTLSATDNTGGSGVKQIVYTTNGTDPSTTNGTVYTGAFTVPATATVKYRAYDNAGNAEAIKSQLVQVDTAAPATTISCNGTACASSFYGAAVSVTLAAADTGGSGLSKTAYTTDGSTPTLTNGTTYSGAFSVSATATVKYRSFDIAGNAEAVKSQLVQIDTVAPASTIACNSSACSSGWYVPPVLVTLAATDNTGGSGVSKIVYTTDGTDPSLVNGTTYSGAFSVASTATVKYRAFDVAGNAEAVKSLTVQVDGAAPSSTIACNGSACTSSFYGAAVSVTLAASDTGGSGLSKIVYTTDGSTPSLTNGSVYSGAFNVASTATVKYRAFDVAGNAEAVNGQTVQVDTTAPVSAISCNGTTCLSGWYGASVSVGLQATDNSGGSGVQETVYTTDGTTPLLSNGTVYSGAFIVSATATVKYRAFDVAGNAETVRSQLIQIDTTAPQTAISCSGSTCSSGFYNAPVSVALQAADGGSGVSKTVYTTDGSDPSLSNGTVYSSAFSLGATTTVKYRSFDVAGNTEQVESQTIQVTVGAPTTTIACNATICTSGWYTAPASVTLAASDNGGPGVNETVYTTDGSTPTTTNGNVYSGAFTVSATTTVEYRSFDNLGNAEAVNSQTVQIDTTAPASTISCNGSACSSGWYAGSAVSVTLQSSDDLGGSGVSKTVYTTDGSDPTTTNGTVYSGAFSLSSSAIVKYRAFDVAGNAEQVESQQLQIDTAAPQTTIACNGGGCASWYNAAISVTLQPADTGGSGLGTTVYTTDGSTPTLSNGTSYGGAFAVSSTTTVKYRSFDVAGNAEQVESQMIGIDIAAPQTTIVCNGTSCSAGWYTSAVTVTLPASDSGGSGISKTVYTTDGSDPSLANGTVYSGAFTVNAPTTVKYRSFDLAANTEQVEAQTIQVDTNAPASTISCNGAACANWYNAAVSVTIAASDNTGGSGVSQIVYTTNGSTPTLVNGTAYAGAFTVSSTTTVKYRAFDTAGNAEQVESQTIGLDTAPPASTTSCNGTSCASSFYSAAVSVTLAATDSGGSGLSKIVYTTDGSTPTLSNGSTYSGAFSVSSPTTVNYRAFDVAGNAEGVNSQLVQVDTTAPVTTVSCNGSACSAGWYNAGVTVTLTGADNTGGSGVSKTVYTTDGSTPTQTNGNTYLAPFLVPATATVKFLSVDNVGNTEGVKSQLVQIDATAPTVSLTAPAANAQLTGQAAFSANASDNVSVARVDFLVDGAVVGSATSSPYTFTWNSASVSDGAHTVQARAVDSAGNTATTTAITVTTSNTAVNLLQNPGLEQGSGNTPTCWLLGGYGTNTSTWAWTTDAHGGSHAENLTISSWTNGDRKLLQNFNATCATPTSAGHQYVVSVWYKSTAKSVIFAFASTTTATGVYNWWAQSSALPVASTWTLATWTTPVVPAGDTFISTGMGMQNVGSVTMDDFSLVQSK